MKKIISVIILIIFLFPNILYANEQLSEVDFKFEHIDLKQPGPIDLVKVTDDTVVICRNNLIPMAFTDNFNTKKYKDCYIVEFCIPCDIVTKECTMLIPKNTTVLAEVECIQMPKLGNRSARVYIVCRKMVFPDGRQFDICARPYENGGVLKKSGWASFAKAAGYTLGGFGLGAGNGAWIGACASEAWKGTWMGMAIGGGTGLISGILTPGLHYKAKRGKVVYMRLDSDIIIPNRS